MRKIEEQMNAAISDCRDWRSGETVVTYDPVEEISHVHLYGNKIAEVEVSEKVIRLYDGDHQTRTTKSRLNAILFAHGEPGDRVFQSEGEWFVTMNTAQGPSTVPFFSSMRLG